MGAASATPSTRRLHVAPADLALLAALVVFALLAVALRGSIAGLGDMATGIRDTGTAIQQSGRSTAGEIRRSVGQAADAVGAVPLLGGQVSATVRDAGERSSGAVLRETQADGARLVQAGEDGRRQARRTANLVGALAFLVPATLLLAVWLAVRRAAAGG